MRSHLLLLAAALVAGMGCRSSVPPTVPPSVTTRDSAGITIVTNQVPAWDSSAHWSVDSTELDLGGPDGEFHGFVSPVNAIQLSDGRIVVADGGANVLYFFGKDGHFLYHVGSAGRAAGQFQSLWGLFRGTADTVITFDIAASRVTRFDPNGALIDTLSFPVPPGSNGYLPLGRSSSGKLLLLRNQTVVPFPGRPWSVAVDSGVVIEFSPTGTSLDSVGPLPVAELTGLPVPKTGGGYITVPINRPLGREASFAVIGDTTWIGTGSAPSFSGYVGGRLHTLVSLPGSLTVAPESLVAEFKRRRRAAGEGGGVLDSIFIASLDSVPFSDYLPAHGHLLGDAAGDLWIQDAGLGELAPGDGSLRWRVIGPGGHWFGSVTLPPRFTVKEIGPDYLLGVAATDSGGPRVRLYHLQKPAGGH